MNLLLHICCGPCALYPLEVLRDEGIVPVGYFFNPNIHPFREYERRVEALRTVAASCHLEMIWDSRGYDINMWFRAVGSDTEQKLRCPACYEMRLEAAAETAAASGMDAFSTTLLYSRYQQHQAIRDTGVRLARRHGLKFFYRDFRQGWQRGIEMAVKSGIYRQPYCGCVFSERERYGAREKRLAASLASEGRAGRPGES